MVFSRDVLKLVVNLLLLDAFNQGLLIVIAFGTILYLGAALLHGPEQIADLPDAGS